MTEASQNYSVMALTAPDAFDWLPIDEAAGVSFSEVHREKLAESISRYLLNLAFEKNGIRSLGNDLAIGFVALNPIIGKGILRVETVCR